MILRRLILLAIVAVGCRESPPAESADSATTNGRAAVVPAVQDSGRRGFPLAGLAMTDTAGRWCVAIANDSLREGTRVTVIFPDSDSKATHRRGSIARHRQNACWAAFPQQSLSELATYDVSIIDTAGMTTGHNSGLGIALLSDVAWSRGQDGILRADLNRDGRLEEAGVCAVDEGQLFTLASRDSVSGMRHNWWQAYYDWGALVDVTCVPEGT